MTTTTTSPTRHRSSAHRQLDGRPAADRQPMGDPRLRRRGRGSRVRRARRLERQRLQLGCLPPGRRRALHPRDLVVLDARRGPPRAMDRLVTGTRHRSLRARDDPADLAESRSSPSASPVSTRSSSPPRCATSPARAAAALHAIVGTLLITGAAAIISIPIGLLTADLPRRVRSRQRSRGHHLPRGRHDRHPLDRRGPVRICAVRDLPRPGHPHRLRRRGRARRCS